MAKSKHIYNIPIKRKDRLLVISDPRAHYGVLKHSIDILVPVGTEIYSAHDGEVVVVKIDSKQGGSDEKYDDKKYLNLIHIKHNNNEYTEYAHLIHKGTAVKIGQYVNTGDLIGWSGNTGLTTAPHLHFHVFKKDNSKTGWKTLEIQFNEPLKVKRKTSELTKKEHTILEKMSS